MVNGDLGEEAKRAGGRSCPPFLDRGAERMNERRFRLRSSNNGIGNQWAALQTGTKQDGAAR